MPLFKRKTFSLKDSPEDLKPRELVYQVRFTKEIFRDYYQYLQRMNLYRQRIWTCKTTGKGNLTYEEALVSERRASEKIKQIPEELMEPVLRTIQFSMLPLRELVNKICTSLQEPLLKGVEMYGRNNNSVCLCRIVKVLEKESAKGQYEVEWLDNNKKSSGKGLVNENDLIRKKLPFTREILKSFVRESTYRNVPWVLHDILAKKYGIPTSLPKELLGSNRKRNHSTMEARKPVKSKWNKVEGESTGSAMQIKSEKEDMLQEEPIEYPIEDTLVQPSEDDPIFTSRPSPSSDFNVPVDCVGDLLMVWSFCSSYGRFLNLSPFSLEDFENAIFYKDTNSTLIVETHSAFLRLLIKDNGEYFSALPERKQKSKITLVTWADYLGDFLDMVDIEELRTCISPIRRGHYGLLDSDLKFRILQELVDRVISTEIFVEKLDEYIEERRALGATKRGEALEEGKKRREEKESMKLDPNVSGIVNKHAVDSIGNNQKVQNGSLSDRNDVIVYRRNRALANSHSSLKNSEDQKVDMDVHEESLKDRSNKGTPRAIYERNKERRKEYFERELEKRVIRANPLGKDRNYNRYWWFPHEARVFVESSDFEKWGYYNTKEEVDALIGSLNCKGIREKALDKQLRNYYRRICLDFQKKSKDIVRRAEVEEAALRRSARIRAPPRENLDKSFLKYVNKWKED